MQAAIAPEPAVPGPAAEGRGPAARARTARWVAIGAAALLVLVAIVLGVAQLVLPGLAAQRLRSQLAASGEVLSVDVRAFPAIELLWHHADSVTIRLGSYRATPATLDQRLGLLGDASTVRASVAQLHDGRLTLTDATLLKRGAAVIASAAVGVAQLRAAVPFLTSVTPVASGGGQLVLRGTADVLGLGVTADATVAARSGAVVVTPDLPFGGLATVTAFSDPHVAVTGVSAGPVAGGFRLAATGIVH